MSPRTPVVSMGEAVHRRNLRVRELLAQHQRDPLVIDIGAGHLHQTDLAAQGRYFSTDIRVLPGLDFAADATQMPLPSAGVDVVMGLELLEHVPDVLAVLRETRRVLRPGGLALFSVPATFPRHDANDYWRFTPQGLTELAGRVFEDARVERFGHTFEALAVLAGYYVQLLSNRAAVPLDRIVPLLERTGHRLDRRVSWARDEQGLHTLNCDLLLVAHAPRSSPDSSAARP